VRIATARFLRDADAEGAPLSPNWKGVAAFDEPSRFTVPIWVMAAGAAVLTTIIYLVLSTLLGSRNDGWRPSGSVQSLRTSMTSSKSSAVVCGSGVTRRCNALIG